MNATQLIEKLLKIPGDTLVVMSSDAEGNTFSPLDSAEPAMYLAENSFSGEHYMTEEQRQATNNPDEYCGAPDEAVPAVFLWPTN